MIDIFGIILQFGMAIFLCFVFVVLTIICGIVGTFILAWVFWGFNKNHYRK